MPESFVAIDVETANADMASICQVGLVRFTDGALVDSWSTLVDPEDDFDDVNVGIHGIDERTVQGAPTIPQIARRLESEMRGALVASHMPFDRTAIARAFDRYGLRPIDCMWIDTARVCRRAWPQFARRGYGLANVATWCGIEFRHHDALEDARAAGEILVRACAETNLTAREWAERALRPTRHSHSKSEPERRTGDPDGPLAGEVVVFTGKLSITRAEAADLAARAGCDVATAVGKTVTVLVVGDQDLRSLAGNTKSSKHRKAEDLIRNGQAMRILGESDFRTMLGFAEIGGD